MTKNKNDVENFLTVIEKNKITTVVEEDNGKYLFITEDGDAVTFDQLELDEHIKVAFCEYAKYVLINRSLPDIRDGLKTGQRRIIYAQNELGNFYNKQYKKSARVVGDVIGKYHPHGDSSVYEALVRMTQPWIMNVPLSIGQGNWGCEDGSSAAAMRYTEVKLSKASSSLVEELKDDTVDWADNYDQSEKEPLIMPAKFPNLLINGTSGIAVGMASKIPPHNPIEVIECVKLYVSNIVAGKENNTEEFIALMPAPDFPTGGLVHGLEQYHNVWKTGRGALRIRSVWHHEVVDGRNCIIVTELPYGVKPSKLLLQIEESCKPDERTEKIKVSGVRYVRDETDNKVGTRIVIALNDGNDPEITFNELCNLTSSQLDISYNYNMNVVKDNEPKPVGIFDCIDSFVKFREDIILKKTMKRLNDNLRRAYLLDGLAKALEKLDDVITVIRKSPDQKTARENLMAFLDIEEEQAKYIVDMSLGRLTSNEVSKTIDDIKTCHDIIDYCKNIIENRAARLDVILQEADEQIEIFQTIKDEDTGKLLYARRRSQYQYDAINIKREDLIPNEPCNLMISRDGFVRRILQSEFMTQNRNTLGNKSMDLAKGDIIKTSLSCSNHDNIAFITTNGRVAFAKAYNISSENSGCHMNNIIKLDADEQISSVTSLSNEIFQDDDANFVFVTEKAKIKQVKLNSFNNKVRRTVIACNLRDDDRIIFCGIAYKDSIITLISDGNRVSMFNVGDQVAVRSRTAGGVNSMKQSTGSKVIGGAVIQPSELDSTLIGCLSNNGRLKVSKLTDYRLASGRLAAGVKAMNLDDKSKLFTAFVFKDSEKAELDVLTITKKAVSNRINIETFGVQNKNTSGKMLIKLAKDDVLISANVVEASK
ncbi:DNA gyrase/topoisomerase IV subunit A [Photobacterium kishitanii]|uniref:DNA topoisomerase (ATP-hydrolyzing) n=1 Tax=Photobacterium kishitanii TaxID=318456 RepID=A0A2T3KMY1_9GAMM|nr:DNA gyrase subunit A [Photobacterium kishitanii]PSV01151.1 hypothetical protein C9J27_03770 [Photobacterium kishitanii]